MRGNRWPRLGLGLCTWLVMSAGLSTSALALDWSDPQRLEASGLPHEVSPVVVNRRPQPHFRTSRSVDRLDRQALRELQAGSANDVFGAPG